MTASIPPITVIAWSEFIDTPGLMYGLFSASDGQLRYDESKVIALQTKSEDARQFHVGSEVEFVAVRKDLTSKPILMHIQASHTQQDFAGLCTIYRRWKSDFAVLLNLAHPYLKCKVEIKFNQALEAIQQGSSVCLEVDIGPAIREWFADMFRQNETCCSTSTTTSSFCRLYVSDSKHYQHCFDCSGPWVVCAPCWLLSAPCYLLHRYYSCVDVMHVVKCPVVLRTGLEDGTIGEHFSGTTDEVYQPPDRPATMDLSELSDISLNNLDD